MGKNSNIEWTDHTFNPWIGCQKNTPGCLNCYAERDFTRKPRWANAWGPPDTSERIRTSEANWKKPLVWNKQAQKEGVRKKVFCASLGDVFEDNAALIDWRLDLFKNLVRNTPNIDWLILTKRPDIASRFFELRPDLLPPNVWLGVSVESRKYIDRIDSLMRTPAAVRFVSFEPLLDDVAAALRPEHCAIDWAIVGGESGPQARHCHPGWVRAMREWARGWGIPFFFKQWGEWLHESQVGDEHIESALSSKRMEAGDGFQYIRIGKKAAGRSLDGREWSQLPEGSGRGGLTDCP